MKQKGMVVLSVILILVFLASCTANTEIAVHTTDAPNDEGGIIFTTNEDHMPEPPPPRISRATSPATVARDASVDVQTAPHGYIAMGYIMYMNDNLYGRAPFTYQELEAALWITQQLLDMGYAQEDIEMQQFSWDDVYQWVLRQWSWNHWATLEAHSFFREFSAREGRISQNVILTVPGQSRYVIVVGAHYDSFLFPGASDNASGVALLLESAERMLHQDNYHTIVYVFFGAEEAGILGSYFFLDSLTYEQRDNIIFMVNADVLFEGPYPLYAAGYSQGNAPQANAVTRRVDDVANELYDLYDVEIGAFPEGIFWRTDHVPFLDAGFTVVVFTGLCENSFDSPHHGARIAHTYRDCIHYINETWPGKAQRAMHAYSVFLERILLARYS